MAELRNIHHPPAYEKSLFPEQEVLKLNQLIGAALTSRSICNRLINQRDISLQSEFNLASETWHYIARVKVTSLEELCQKLLQFQIEERAS